MKKGWWYFELKGVEHSELSDISREHVADLIIKGFTEGEIIEKEEDDENT